MSTDATEHVYDYEHLKSFSDFPMPYLFYKRREERVKSNCWLLKRRSLK